MRLKSERRDKWNACQCHQVQELQICKKCPAVFGAPSSNSLIRKSHGQSRTGFHSKFRFTEREQSFSATVETVPRDKLCLM